MANESQFEFFTHSSAASPAVSERTLYLKPKVVLTFDNLIVLSIALLLLMVISFSVGVERGKSIVRVEHKVIDLSDKKPVSLTANPDRNSKSLEHPVPAVSAVSSPLVKTAPVPVPAAVAQSVPVVSVTENSTEQDMYTVQVASFKQEKYAQQEAMALKQKGYKISVLLKGKHSIVCVGKFAQKQEAVAMSGKLRKYYKDCVVRNL